MELDVYHSHSSGDFYSSSKDDLHLPAWTAYGELKLGMRVLVNKAESGVVRFLGEVHFKEGVWCGVELDRGVGRHGGSVEGRAYFNCPQGFGILAPVHRVSPEKMNISSEVRMRKSQNSMPRCLQPSHWKAPDIGPEQRNLNRTITLDSPDIVTSCDLRSESVDLAQEASDLRSDASDRRSDTSHGSKRSSADMDESLGILSPSQMKEFSVTSMTQSMASNCSMVKDISWDELNTLTEDPPSSVDVTLVTSPVGYCRTFTDVLNRTVSLNEPRSEVMNTTFSVEAGKERRMMMEGRFSMEAGGERRKETRLSSGRAYGPLRSSQERHKSKRDRVKADRTRYIRSPELGMFDSHGQGRGRDRGAEERGRFCLDSSKLEEIEALGSSPLQSSMELRLNSTFDLSPPLSPSNSSGAVDRFTPRDFKDCPDLSPVRGERSLNEMLQHRTETLLRCRNKSAERSRSQKSAKLAGKSTRNNKDGCAAGKPGINEIPRGEIMLLLDQGNTSQDVESIDLKESSRRRGKRSCGRAEETESACSQYSFIISSPEKRIRTQSDEEHSQIPARPPEKSMDNSSLSILRSPTAERDSTSYFVSELHVSGRKSSSSLYRSGIEIETTGLSPTTVIDLETAGLSPPIEADGEAVGSTQPFSKPSTSESDVTSSSSTPRPTGLSTASATRDASRSSPSTPSASTTVCAISVSANAEHPDQFRDECRDLEGGAETGDLVQDQLDTGKSVAVPVESVSLESNDTDASDAVTSLVNPVTSTVTQVTSATVRSPVNDEVIPKVISVKPLKPSDTVECEGGSKEVTNSITIQVKPSDGGGESSIPHQLETHDPKVKDESSTPLTPETKRRLRPHNKLLEKVQMISDSLSDSTCSQGKNSLFDSQYSTTEPHSLAVSVTLSTDMESSGFFSDIDGRLSTTVYQLEEVESGVQSKEIYANPSQQMSLVSSDIPVEDEVDQPAAAQQTADGSPELRKGIDLPVPETVRKVDLQQRKVDHQQNPEDEKKDSADNKASDSGSEKTQIISQKTEPAKKKPEKSTSTPGKSTPVRGEKSFVKKRKDLLRETPILPNTKVESKLKLLLSEPPKPREARVKKPGKWDAIMDRIERSKQAGQTRAKSSLDSVQHKRRLKLSRDGSVLSSKDGSHDSRTRGSLSSLDSLPGSPHNTVSEAGVNSGCSDLLSPKSDRSSVLDSPKRKGAKLRNKENVDRKASVGQESTSRTKEDFRPKTLIAAGQRSHSLISSSKTKSVLSPKNAVSPTLSEKSANDRRVSRSSGGGGGSGRSDGGGESVLSVVDGGGGGIQLADVQKYAVKRSGSNVSTISRVSSSSGRSQSKFQSTSATVTPQRKTPLTRSSPKPSSSSAATKPVSKNSSVTASSTPTRNKVAEINRKNAKLSRPNKGTPAEQRGLGGDQPDLLKETIRKESKKEANLATVSAQKAARWNAEGFNMMAVVANYYIQRCSASETREGEVIRQRKEAQEENEKNLTNLQKELTAKLEAERETWKADLEKEKLRQVELESVKRKEISDLEDRLQKELETRSQIEENSRKGLEDLEKRLREESEREKAELTARYAEDMRQEKSAVEERLKAETDLRSQFEAEKADIQARFDEQLAEARRETEQRLRDELTTPHTTTTAEKVRKDPEKKTSKKVDYRLEAEKERAGRLEQEVESLRTVLEMKTEELHASRLSRIKLEEKLAEYEKKEESWRKASAQVEDLKEQLAARMEVERRLMGENRSLSNLMEREQNEKKRLSMENEQLTWKIKQECEGMSHSFCEGTDYSLPIIGNFRGSFASRPLSAPPGKNNQSLNSMPFMDHPDSIPPDSPRVLEVVEKIESVAWKLEYDLPESSPRVTRKMCPQSPLFLRKAKSSGLMTRSLDRANMLTRSNSSPSTTSSPLLKRTSSVRKKVSSHFETLDEFTDESDESRKTSPDEPDKAVFPETVELREKSSVQLEQPRPVDIGMFEDDICEISSSSEIEVGDPDSLNTDTTDSDLYPAPPSSSSSACPRQLSISPSKQQQLLGSSPCSEQLQQAQLLGSPVSEPHSPVTELTLVAGQPAEESDTDLSEGHHVPGVCPTP